MKKFNNWFKNLSRVGRFGFISAVALSGLVVLSAAAQSSSPSSPVTPDPSPTITQPEAKKESVITTKIETKTESIPFEKKTIESSTLAKGTTEVQTIGVNGSKTITYTITLTDGVETDRTSLEVITAKPVTQVTVVGTYVEPVSNCNPNYSGCVPNVSYDLDCPDIGYQVVVTGYDQYNLDGDNDGYGCESY